MASVQVVNISLPSLPSGWSAEKDFKAVGALSAATQRNIEPVGPHFLAHARRVCVLNEIRLPLMRAAIKICFNNLLEAPRPHFLRG